MKKMIWISSRFLALLVFCTFLFACTYKMYTVDFVDDNGTTLHSAFVKQGKDATPPNDPVKVGYTFAGWDKAYTSVMSDLSVNATYTINEYTISFDVNGGSSAASITQDYQTTVTAPTAPTKTGYTFSGWYANTLLTTPYQFTTMPAVNTTVYAKWTIIQYAVTFTDYDDSVLKLENVNQGSSATAPSNPARTGYTFSGWDNSFSNITTNVTIKATYTTNEYSIQFNDHDGSVLQTTNYLYGASLSSHINPGNPTRTGYTFDAWSQVVPATMPAQNVVITASYTTNEYTIQFNDHDGSVLQTTNYLYGASLSSHINPTNPTRTGYTFNAWDPVVPATMPANDVVITATYNAASYTMSFNSNGGTEVTSITQNYLTSVADPTPPTQSNMDFAGWYSDEALTQIYTINTMPAQNITLYAKWNSSGLSFTLIDGGTHYSVARGIATGNIVIPSMYNGLPVTAISNDGFTRFGQTWVFTSLTIPEGILSIGTTAFMSLPWTSVTLPSSLVSLGMGVFGFNSNLTTINIPANVSSIGEQTFSSSMGLTSITVDLANDHFTSLDGVLFNDDMTTIIAYPPGKTATTYTVPTSVTMVAAYSFRQMNILQSLVFQTGLTTIAGYAITNSSSLTSIYIPLSVTTIAASAISSNATASIYVTAASKPVGWSDSWNANNRPVTWGYIY